jgi:signal transduction histidine kinase
MSLRTVLLNVCVGLVAWMGAALPAAAARHVVLLFDERVELPGLSLIEAEIVRTLDSDPGEPIEVYREAMDLSRFSSDSYKTLLRDFLRAKYADKKIDVVVAVMAPALDFLLSPGDAVFPGSQIVFCGIDRAQLGDRSLPPHVRGVLVKREFGPTLELALRLHPTTERVVVVAGKSAFDTQLLATARQEFGAFENRVSFTYLTDLPLERLLTELSQLPAKTIVLFISFFQDGAGQPFVPHEVVARIDAAASAPVYGFVDQYIGRGIVGGAVYSLSAHGTQAAKLVLQVLAGTASSQPALLEAPSSKVMFDWRQMQQWNISDVALPPGSEIRFRDPTVWERYRWQIVMVAAALLLQTLLITLLIYERRHRRFAEVEALHRMDELAHMNRHATVGELSASIAHEINQPLGAILNNAETAAILLDSPSPDVKQLKEIIAEIKRDDQRASRVIDGLRRLLKSKEFNAEDVDLNHVVREVSELLSAQAFARKVVLTSSLSPQSLRVSGDFTQIQQVILILIVNSMDAMASTEGMERKVTIRTALINGGAEVSVADSGPGIEQDKLARVFEPFFTTKEHGMGMGLSIARTIVEHHHGRIWAENQAEGGAVFRVRFPLA